MSPTLGSSLQRIALENARRALDDIRGAVAERAALHEVGQRQVVRLSRTEIVELLQRQTVGRFVYIARKDVPDVVPVNYVWTDGCVLIRSAPGPKLHAAERGDTVAFEVDEIDLENRTGSSAVVVGRASVVDPRTTTHEVDVWAAGPHRHLIRITPTRIEGRRLG